MTTVSEVPVDGGRLTIGQWGSPADGSPVLAIHGITGSHRSWALVAEAHQGPVIAPDLRGRGGSGTLAGPYGMAAHAADCVAVLDALGIEQATVVGHSMGGFVAAVLTNRYPSRVRRLVLVDGGVPFDFPPDTNPETVLGPTVQRLTMRFESPEAYRDYWRQHPSFANWSAAIESYVDYDLTGEPPRMRSKVNADAVRADYLELLTGDEPKQACAALPKETVFLRAERGMFNELPALYPDPAAIELNVTTVPGTNHYTILLSDDGARAVATALS
jgi:lipase